MALPEATWIQASTTWIQASFGLFGSAIAIIFGFLWSQIQRCNKKYEQIDVRITVLKDVREQQMNELERRLENSDQRLSDELRRQTERNQDGRDRMEERMNATLNEALKQLESRLTTLMLYRNGKLQLRESP